MSKKGKSPKFSPQSELQLVFLTGITIISFSILLIEITLIRISSITFTYHYSFVAVSLALLGVGVGGAISNIRAQDKQFNRLSRKMLIASLLVAITIQITTVFSITSLSNEDLIIFCLLMSIPFICWGFGLSLVFRLYPDESGRIYAANLLGSSIGSIASILFLDHFGGVDTAFIAGAFCSFGTMLMVPRGSVQSSRQTRNYIIIIGLIVILTSFTWVFLNRNGAIIPVGTNPNKELNQYLKEGWEIVDTRWSAFGRTDVIESKTINYTKLVFVDGSAGSFMYYFNGNFSDTRNAVNQLRNTTAFFPYYFGSNDKILIIGPGGGKDILTAIMGEGKEITGVEINKRILDVVEDYSSYNGYIYTNYSSVKIIYDEGRSYLTHSNEKYDLIILNLAVTLTNQGLSGYSLVENFLFTQEAMTDYIKHLSEEGRLIIVSHNIYHVYKLVAIFKSLSDSIKNNEALNNVVIVAELSADKSYYRFPVFILKKTPFNEIETGAMYNKTNELGLLPIFFPDIQEEGFDHLLSNLASGRVTLNDFILSSPVNLNPPKDDKPFFYNFDKSIPKNLSYLMNASGLVCALTLIFPFVYQKINSDNLERDRMGPQKPNLLLVLTYISFLGISFVLIEYALIQKFILFLGNPIFANAFTLAFILCSSGLGSLYSSKLNKRDLIDIIPRTLLAIGSLAIAYTFVVPVILNQSLGFEFSFRVLICLLLVFPIGFIMGIPFPSFIRLLKADYQNDLSWFFGVDGVFSVFSFILSVVIALSFGFNVVLFIGGIVYFFAYFLFKNIKFQQ